MTDQVTITINREEAERFLKCLEHHHRTLCDICCEHEFKHEEANARWALIKDTIEQLAKKLGKDVD